MVGQLTHRVAASMRRVFSACYFSRWIAGRCGRSGRGLVFTTKRQTQLNRMYAAEVARGYAWRYGPPGLDDGPPTPGHVFNGEAARPSRQGPPDRRRLSGRRAHVHARGAL